MNEQTTPPPARDSDIRGTGENGSENAKNAVSSTVVVILEPIPETRNYQEPFPDLRNNLEPIPDMRNIPQIWNQPIQEIKTTNTESMQQQK